jgi:hypothetical protein
MNRFIDQSLDVFVPITRPQLSTDTERNGDSTEDGAFVRPLVKSKPFSGRSEAALFAKMAPRSC